MKHSDYYSTPNLWRYRCLNSPRNLFAAVVCSLTLLVAPAIAGSADPNAKAKEVLQLLKKIDSEAHEWGGFTISDLLLEPNKKQFDLSYTNTPTEKYVEAARKMQNGRATSSDFRSFSGRFDATADLLPRINAGKAAGSGVPAQPPAPASDPNASLIGEIPGLTPTKAQVTITQTISNGIPIMSTNVVADFEPANDDAPPPAPSSKRPKIELPKVDATSFGGGSTPGGLPSVTSDLGISERQALDQGISDKVAELLHRQIVNPLFVPKGQSLVFGIAQVSCQPGWRTVNDYIADLKVSVAYAKKGNGDNKATPVAGIKLFSEFPNDSSTSWEYSTSQTPSIYAVLPLTDSLQFDLANRQQRELDLAGSLAATFAAQGLVGEAKALARYIRKRDSNVESASMLPVATTYSDGGSFGFRIYPRPQGIVKPGDPFAGSGNVLQPVNFPVLVAFLVDNDVTETNKTKTNWTHFKISTQVSWIPVRGKMGPLKKGIRLLAPNYTGGNQRQESDLSEQANLVARLDKAADLLNEISNVETATAQLARRSYESLRRSLFGYDRVAALPDFGDSCTKKPTPEWSIDPGPVQQFFATNGLFNTIIRLSNADKEQSLENIEPKVWIAGNSARVEAYLAEKGAALIVANINLTNMVGPADLSIAVKWGTSLVAGNLPAQFPSPKKPKDSEKKNGIELNPGATIRMDGKIPEKVQLGTPQP